MARINSVLIIVRLVLFNSGVGSVLIIAGFLSGGFIFVDKDIISRDVKSYLFFIAIYKEYCWLSCRVETDYPFYEYFVAALI